MPELFTLTQQPVRYTTTSGTALQPAYAALDVSTFDMLDVEVALLGNEGAVGTFTLDLYTSMQIETDADWVLVGNLLNTTAIGWWDKKTFTTGLLRYIRWRVSAISGGTAITFFVRGMGRSYT